MDPNPNPAASPAAPVGETTDDLRSFLVEKLSLQPAEGAEAVTDEQIRSALSAAVQAGSDAGGQIADLQSKLDAATAELAEVKNTASEAEIDGLLAPYADRIQDEAAKSAVRDLLKTNRDAGLAILKALPAPAKQPSEGKKEKSPVDAAPPAPMHDPAKAGQSGPTEQEIAAAISTLAKKYQAENPQLAFAGAWSKAEKEISAKIAAGQPIS